MLLRSGGTMQWRTWQISLLTVTLFLAGCAGSVPAGEPPTPAVTSPPPTQVPQAESISGDVELAAELDAQPERILLTLHDANGDDLAIWNRVTGEFMALASSPFSEGHATWSPDGEWIAFQTDRDDNWEIYIVRPTCEEPSMGCNDDLRNLTNDPANDMYPNWSPAGQVVHMSTRGGNPDIWLTPLDEGQPEPLTDHPGPDWHPNLSPLGGALALRSDRGDNPEIWGIDLSTGGDQNLTSSAGTDRYPGYSPDGTRILFVSNRDGDEEIYVMDADGGNQANLTNHPARDYQGSWSPDGRYVLFMSDRAGEGDLYLMDVESGEVRLMLDAAVPLDWPFWAPVD
jgi:Tol biopolymer transport system component